MIDINCDMGELNELMDDGTYEALMDHVTSINVACGGHAGDDVMMNTMVELAIGKKVNIGAHPSYPDKENFGRNEIDISISALKDSISAQIINLMDITNKHGSELSHVKPHGALYNKAAEDKGLAMLVGSDYQTTANFSIEHITNNSGEFRITINRDLDGLIIRKTRLG